MRVGDKFPVTISGQTVAYAEVKEIEKDSATLIVPATRVVMATRVEFTEAPGEESSHVLLGEEEATEDVSDSAAAAVSDTDSENNA